MWTSGQFQDLPVMSLTVRAMPLVGSKGDAHVPTFSPPPPEFSDTSKTIVIPHFSTIFEKAHHHHELVGRVASSLKIGLQVKVLLLLCVYAHFC
jgi:hypothetical protein